MVHDFLSLPKLLNQLQDILKTLKERDVVKYP